MSTTVNQSRSTAQGDMVGGDKVVNNNYVNSAIPIGVIEKLLLKLQEEMEKSPEKCEFIDNLLRFRKGRKHDGVIGLEGKLQAGGRSDEYEDALERKEMFVKLLDSWSMYASAQQIFVHLLARAEHYFFYTIQPQLGVLTTVEVNELTTKLIVDPTVNDCGSSVFEIDHNVAMGMVYWLAEQCFVRWHK
jgi:hypothetical protein